MSPDSAVEGGDDSITCAPPITEAVADASLPASFYAAGRTRRVQDGGAGR